MNLLRLPWRQAEPADDDADDAELDEPTYLREHMGLVYRRRVSEAYARPLLWSVAPPREPGNYYCRRPGDSEYILVQVQPGDEYGLGMQWAGPLPTPYEPRKGIA